MKRIKQNYYSIQKYVFENHYLKLKENENGYLFANGQWATKIKAEDLPEWFVYGRYYKKFGYMSAKGIVDMVYRPNMTFNHFLRDDMLYISYDKKITIDDSDESYIEFDGYDLVVYGSHIIDFLKAARQYSNYDITTIQSQVIDKFKWFRETYPDERECEHETVESIKARFE